MFQGPNPRPSAWAPKGVNFICIDIHCILYVDRLLKKNSNLLNNTST